MALLTRLTLIEGGALLLGFFGVCLYKMAMGEISLAGLLYTKDPSVPADGAAGGAPGEKASDATFSPARLQLLIFTVVVAANYLHGVIVNPHQDALPGLPQGVVAALGGSQALYLGGKALSAFIQPLHRNLR